MHGSKSRTPTKIATPNGAIGFDLQPNGFVVECGWLTCNMARGIHRKGREFARSQIEAWLKSLTVLTTQVWLEHLKTPLCWCKAWIMFIYQLGLL